MPSRLAFPEIAVASVIALLTACGSALAAPVTVELRIEGSASTIFEGPVTTDGKPIDKGDGPHPCDGTTASPPQAPGPTMTSALDDAGLAGGFTWEGTWFSFGDFLITKVAQEAPVAPSYWGTVLNYQPTPVGGCQQQVHAGDELLFAAGDIYSQPLLRLSGPNTAAAGQPVTVSVTDGKDGSAAGGATVAGAVAGPDGRATVSFDTPGVKQIKADHSGSIRSNSLYVCVYRPGSGDCNSFVPPTAVLARPGLARDSRAPTARIASPRDGAVYARGPRLLRGSARDDQSGVAEVKLALRRHVGASCRWWSGRRERFVGTNCRKTFFFAIGSNPDWSYLLPRHLPRGRYVLDVKAFDRARNRVDRFDRGGSRIVFEVRPPRSAHRGRAARAAPTVGVMVAGAKGLLADARSVRSGSVTVRASGRRCRVPAATPLAALARALSRAHVGYHVRDFGHCSAQRASDSAELFVDRIGRERNRGQNGWFYKVDGRAGTAGAADPSALPGRVLRAGQHVLWFYCVFDKRARSCQPSVEVLPPRNAGASGEPFVVHVRGRDNEGRARPLGGALVTFGPVSSKSDTSGVARLSVPGAGRYSLRASKDGTVPSFPVSVVVGR